MTISGGKKRTFVLEWNAFSPRGVHERLRLSVTIFKHGALKREGRYGNADYNGHQGEPHNSRSMASSMLNTIVVCYGKLEFLESR